MPKSPPRHNPYNASAYNKAYNAGRPNAYQAGYDHKWAAIRARKLRIDPLCERCRTDGLYVEARIVHHKDGNPRHNHESNLESLCWSCHEKTKG